MHSHSNINVLPTELLTIILWICQQSWVVDGGSGWWSFDADITLSLVCNKWRTILSNSNRLLFKRSNGCLFLGNPYEIWQCGIMTSDDQTRIALSNGNSGILKNPTGFCNNPLCWFFRAGWFGAVQNLLESTDDTLRFEPMVVMNYLMGFILRQKDLRVTPSLSKLLRYFSERFSKEWNPLSLYCESKGCPTCDRESLGVSYYSMYYLDECDRENLMKEFPDCLGFAGVDITQNCRFCYQPVCVCKCKSCHQIGTACRCWCYKDSCNLARRLSRYPEDEGPDGHGLCLCLEWDDHASNLGDDRPYNFWEWNQSNNYMCCHDDDYEQDESADLYMDRLEFWACQGVLEDWAISSFFDRAESWTTDGVAGVAS